MEARDGGHGEVVVDDWTPSELEHLGTIELYSEDSALTSHGEGTRRVREGRVAVHHPVVYSLRHADFPDLITRRTDAANLVFALVHFRFDLLALGKRRHYAELRFGVSLDDETVRAFSLHPTSVTSPVDVERDRRFTISPGLALIGLGDGPGEFSSGKTFRYTELRPMISASGEGSSSFSWTFDAQEGAPLTPGGRACFAVIELPVAFMSGGGAFTADVVVRRRILGVLTNVTTISDRLPFTVHMGPTGLVFGAM
ncbi:MAG: hypothetical protein S0880_33530 [Actinomycetota bacterium]|nr:hypothetical protein [Actinomycetota bacterium]